MKSRYALTLQAGLCLVGCVQLVAWTSLAFQLPYLYGRAGVQPISSVLAGTHAGQQQLQLEGKPTPPAVPSVLWLHGTLGLTAEALLAAVCSVGLLLSASAACGFLTHPLVFGALWLLYLSFVSLGGSFVEYGDEVLLGVCFASIWAAVAHSMQKRTAQQQQQQQTEPTPSQRVSTAVLMLHKWLLFRLLLTTSTFSATLLCGQDGVLSSCFRTLVAHGQPHTATRWLQALPGPVRAAAAAISLLELPAAFCALLYVPTLQRAAGVGLLVLQLLRICWGSAGLTNLAAAVLCFMLLDDALWVPAVGRLAQSLGLGGQAAAEDVAEQGQHEGGGTQILSRTSSGTSLFEGEMGDAGVLGAHHLGETTAWDDFLAWLPSAVLVALLSCAALLLTYSSGLGLLLRPSPAQLYSVLQVAVPVGMLVWLGTCAPACWLAVSAVCAACKADAAAARNDAQVAAAKAAEESTAAAAKEKEAEQAAAQAASATPTSAAAAGAASTSKANGATSNGLHAAGDADAAAGAAAEAEHAEEEGHEQAPTRGRKKATGTKAGSKKGAAAQHAQDGEPGSPAAGAGTPPATSKAASASKAAKAAQEAAKKADAAREAAATHKQAAAAAAAEAAQHKRHAAVGAWVPAVCAVAAAVAVLTVFVVGTPQLLTAVNYNPASIRRFVPGPVLHLSQVGRAFGLTSGTSSARASYAATQAAAAAAGPGAILQYEAYVMNGNADGGGSVWKKVPLNHMLGSAHLKSRASLWHKVVGARGLFQTRLQARMAAAGQAGDQGEATTEPWLVMLADKLVQGTPDIAGVLGGTASPHEFVTINRIAYTHSDSSSDWHREAVQPPAVEPQHRDSTRLRTFSQLFQAVPGDDGWLVSVMERLAKALHGPFVLTLLLGAVTLRHLLLPGGLLGECRAVVEGEH